MGDTGRFDETLDHSMSERIWVWVPQDRKDIVNFGALFGFPE